jgi:hypothetical protein
LHPWCTKCGVIKNISDDRPKKLGYWMNELSRLAKNRSFSQSQVRLIAKSLQSHESFHDLFGVNGSVQEKIFLKIVKKYTHTVIRCLDSSVC